GLCNSRHRQRFCNRWFQLRLFTTCNNSKHTPRGLCTAHSFVIKLCHGNGFKETSTDWFNRVDKGKWWICGRIIRRQSKTPIRRGAKPLTYSLLCHHISSLV